MELEAEADGLGGLRLDEAGGGGEGAGGGEALEHAAPAGCGHGLFPLLALGRLRRACGREGEKSMGFWRMRGRDGCRCPRRCAP